MITPRVAWELSAAMVAVSFAVAYVASLLLEGADTKNRVAVLLVLILVQVVCIGVGLSSGILLKDEGFSLLSRAFFLGATSPYSYLILGGTMAATLLTVKNMKASESALASTSS